MRELLVESPRDCGYRYVILVDEMTVGGMMAKGGCGIGGERLSLWRDCYR